MAKKKKQRRDRRTFTDEFKKDVVKRAQSGERVTDLAEKFDIQASQISMWKRQITGKPGRRGRRPGSTNAGAPKAAPKAAAAPSASSKDAYIAKLEEMVGKLTIENLRLRSGK